MAVLSYFPFQPREDGHKQWFMEVSTYLSLANSLLSGQPPCAVRIRHEPGCYIGADSTVAAIRYAAISQ